MQAEKVIPYFGITLLMGCSISLVFTMVFMLLLHIEIGQAYLAICFFASLAVLGGFTVKYFRFKEEKEGTQINEE